MGKGSVEEGLGWEDGVLGGRQALNIKGLGNSSAMLYKSHVQKLSMN